MLTLKDVDQCETVVELSISLNRELMFPMLKAALDKDTIRNDYVQNSFEGKVFFFYKRTGKKEGIYLFLFSRVCDLYLAPGEVGRGSAALSPRIFILLLCSTTAKSCKK